MDGWFGGGDPPAPPITRAELSSPAPASCSVTRGVADGVGVVSGSSCVSPAGGVAAGVEVQPEVVEPRWAALGSPGNEKVGRAQRFTYILFSSLRIVSRGRNDVAVSTGTCDVRFVLS